jgi:serine protease Do
MLGVKVQNIDDDTAAALGLAAAQGAFVTEVMPDGPAAMAGLKANDAILSLNGQAVASSKDFARRISGQAPGSTVELKIHRAGGEQTINAKLGAMPQPDKEASADEPASPAATGGGPRLGLKLMPGAKGEGVVIAEVASNSDAASKGITSGDLILEVDGKAVANPGEVIDNVKSLQNKGRKAVLLLVKSGEHTRTVPVRFSVAG